MIRSSKIKMLNPFKTQLNIRTLTYKFSCYINWKNMLLEIIEIIVTTNMDTFSLGKRKGINHG